MATLVGALVCFILLLKNFYVWGTTCSWCKYLSCLPVTVNGVDWCQIGNLDFKTTNSTLPPPGPDPTQPGGDPTQPGINDTIPKRELLDLGLRLADGILRDVIR